MNAKPAIGWLNADGDVPLINDVSVVLKAQADNVLIFTNPDPPLAEIQLSLDNFSTAVHMLNRTPADTINKNNLRLVLTNKVRLLSYYVAKVCNGNLANLILSGFPPQKPAGQPVGIPGQPQNLSVSHGAAAQPVGGQVQSGFWRGHLQLPSAGEHARRGAGDRTGHGHHPYVQQFGGGGEIHH